MDRGQKIARALGRGYDKLRTIFLSGTCLQVLTGDQNGYAVAATYDTSWYLDRREYNDLATGKRFILLKVADHEGCRLEDLKKMTAVQIGNPQIGWMRWKVPAKPTFIPGMVPIYEFKL